MHPSRGPLQAAAVPCSTQTLGALINALEEAGYDWQPQTPDRLLACRKNPEAFRPLTMCLGLGLPVSAQSLIEDGLSAELIDALKHDGFAAESPDGLTAAIAISLGDGALIPHDHWPPRADQAAAYVHFGPESFWLSRELNRDLEWFTQRNVLDLGCSSGALSFSMARVARSVLGIDISQRSVLWGQAFAEAYGLSNLKFVCAEIGQKSAEDAAKDAHWDVAVMNPPMMIPIPNTASPHRDGGQHGVELPLLFLDFAHHHLKSGGEMYCLATNPIIHGRGEFFERFNLNASKWDVLEQRRLHTHFNQAAARKQHYADHGIDRVELWYLRLQKK